MHLVCSLLGPKKSVFGIEKNERQKYSSNQIIITGYWLFIEKPVTDHFVAIPNSLIFHSLIIRSAWRNTELETIYMYGGTVVLQEQIWFRNSRLYLLEDFRPFCQRERSAKGHSSGPEMLLIRNCKMKTRKNMNLRFAKHHGEELSPEALLSIAFLFAQVIQNWRQSNATPEETAARADILLEAA